MRLYQLATLNPPSYAMIDDEEYYIDENFLNEYGDWIIIDSWERVEDDYRIFEIEPPTIN